jgi:hypothetical protein
MWSERAGEVTPYILSTFIVAFAVQKVPFRFEKIPFAVRMRFIVVALIIEDAVGILVQLTAVG